MEEVFDTVADHILSECAGAEALNLDEVSARLESFRAHLADADEQLPVPGPATA